MSINKIAVLGAGAWGTALALAAQRAGRQTVLWARRPEQAEAMSRTHKNILYLPDIQLPPELTITNDPVEAASDADAIMLVIPAQHMRETLAAFDIPPGIPLICAAKGIELSTGKTMSAVLQELLPGNPVVILSGPSFASETAAGKPTAVTLAAAEGELALTLVDSLRTATFRPYASSDIVGTEVGGAVKNVLAIAAGIVSGMGMGENARAALITWPRGSLPVCGRAWRPGRYPDGAVRHRGCDIELFQHQLPQFFAWPQTRHGRKPRRYSWLTSIDHRRCSYCRRARSPGARPFHRDADRRRRRCGLEPWRRSRHGNAAVAVPTDRLGSTGRSVA